jgi:hypothetical protein
LSRISRTRRTSCALQSQRDSRRHLNSRSGILICSIRPCGDRKPGAHNRQGRSPGPPARSRGLSVSQNETHTAFTHRRRHRQQGYTKFVSDVELYEIASESERELHAKNASTIADPAKRRETKIKQYQSGKDLRTRIEVKYIKTTSICTPHSYPQAVAQRHRVPLPPSDSAPTDFELIAALLPRPAHSASDNNDEQDDEDGRRAATILLLRLAYAQAHAQLSSIAQELELLRSAPPPPPSVQPGSSDRAEEEHTLWRLDAPSQGMGQRGSGPLLDSAGKVSSTAQRSTARGYLMLIRMYYSRCSHSRYCPLAQAAIAQGSERKCSRRTTVCLPCPSTNTSRLSGSAVTFSREEGKAP